MTHFVLMSTTGGSISRTAVQVHIISLKSLDSILIETILLIATSSLKSLLSAFHLQEGLYLSRLRWKWRVQDLVKQRGKLPVFYDLR